MTDTATDAFGAPVELDEQTAEIRRLNDELAQARRQAADYHQAARRWQTQLQDGVHEVANNDRDFAEQLVEFLNENTPWEFTLERRYRVRITATVYVTAESEEDAGDRAMDFLSGNPCEGNPEIDDMEWREVDVVDD